MSSTYTVSPASLHDRDHSKDRTQGTYHNVPDSAVHTTPGDSQLLSPYSSQHHSNAASPAGNSNTPAESISTVSAYQSDFSSELDDPFFGANFNDIDAATPSFLDDQLVNLDSLGEPSYHPLTPHKSPSEQSPPLGHEDFGLGIQNHLVQPDIAVSGALYNSSETEPFPSLVDSSNLLMQSDIKAESWTHEDNLVPVSVPMAGQSPQVTVSMWGGGSGQPVTADQDYNAATAGSPSTVRATIATEDDDPLNSNSGLPPTKAEEGQESRFPGGSSSRHGIAPEHRPTDEVPSLNQQAARRQVEAQNKKVAAWVSGFDHNQGMPSDTTTSQRDRDDQTPAREIGLGDQTENKIVSGQTYYTTDSPGGPLDQTDLDLINENRNWADAPMVQHISQPTSGQRHQPESSQAAIEKFERMYRDSDSIVSRAATWGTRRRSLPSISDVEGVVSGNFLKKLSIRGDSRRPNLLKKIPSLVRRPSTSQILKRKGTTPEDTGSDHPETSERRESRDSLAPPSRTGSWGINRKPTPSLNTAIVGMATGAASIGATHARSGSISATSITSPKSPSFLPVRNSIRRPRSKTELPRGGNADSSSTPHLVEMLKKAGGPPVAHLASGPPTVQVPRSHPALDLEDDDDDEDDGFDDTDMKIETESLEIITPTFQGFQEHILRLNPGLAGSDGMPHPNSYLVDRIAHQMIVRYKQLQQVKIKHLGHVSNGVCPCGPRCIALGGAAISLESKSDARRGEPMSARPDSSEGDTTPLEGTINRDSFPAGIPMPPASLLPAEFECQLCYTSKKFQKPSDWTKHVHEDVQPFTCTWDRCRDPRMFKRKADWVRHENESHRHLEWWTCDVDDCRHTCYRRDNFLQHLVREHKFTEPKNKTKAAIKKAGGGEPTWQKVEACHVETHATPAGEPCRFCGKQFPSWKKLTVHLAKHMEQISLPVLRLVTAKDLDADTIISPVQDPPPRTFNTISTPVKQEPPTFNPHNMQPHVPPSPMDYQSAQAFGYPISRDPIQGSYYQPQGHTQYGNVPSTAGSGLMMPPITAGYMPQQPYQNLPVTNPPYGQAAGGYMTMSNQLEQFPPYNPMGMQDTTGASLGFQNLQDPNLQNVEQYSNQGSASPYSHSPHQGVGPFYQP